MDFSSLLAGYDPNALSVASMGGHSALDISSGARRMGFRTVVAAPRGGEKVYTEIYRTHDGRGCVDQTIVLPDAKALYTPQTVEQLRAAQAVFVHDRLSAEAAEDLGPALDAFNVPIFGSRSLLKLERSTWSFNQDHLLSWSGIRTPRTFASADELDGTLCIVKAKGANHPLEPAFFLVTDKVSWMREGNRLEMSGRIAPGWEQATIEEFVLGAAVNFNFFYSPLRGELELMGTDFHRMTNLDGFLRMTADQQLKALEQVDVRMREAGQMVCTVNESLLEQVFEMGWSFVRTTQKLQPEFDAEHRGIIGPFALQGAMTLQDGKEEIVIYDVSFRMPGSPNLRSTPYSSYLFGEPMSMGERVARELKEAVSANCLDKVLT